MITEEYIMRDAFLSDEDLINIRKSTPFKSSGPWADSLSFARAVLKAQRTGMVPKLTESTRQK